jgi:replicative DNA helicase
MVDFQKHAFDPQTIGQRTVALVKNRKETQREAIETGIGPLDEILNPMRPGELIVILGFTRNYKSGLMNYIARYHARKLRDEPDAGRKAVITFTWEQSIEEQGIVDISQLTTLDTTKMMRGTLTDEEWDTMLLGAMRRGALPWWLVGHSSEDNERRPRLNMSEVGQVLEWIVDTQDIKPALIVLDYLQRIQREKGASIREQFIDIVDKAKDLALAFHVPVLLGSQAKREINTRDWRLPRVDDGQETSNLEQSADKLISVWMPKNDYPTGHIFQYGASSYEVQDNLLILGLMKQKFGPAPRILQMNVYPETNDITPIVMINLDKATR